MYNEYMGSASGLEPQIGYRPNGFLGGMQYARQEQDYQGQLGLQNLTRMLGLVKQQQEMDEYNQNAPVRKAERTFKLEDFGQQTRAAPSKYDAQITKDKITTQYAGKEAEFKDWEHGQKKVQAAHELMGGELDALLNSKLPPSEAVQRFRNEVVPRIEAQTNQKLPDWMKDPNVIRTPEDMQRLLQSIVHTTKQMQALEVKKMAEEGLNKRNAATNQNHIDVETIRGRWHERTANRDRLTTAQVNKDTLDRWIKAEFQNLVAREQQNQGKTDLDPQTLADLQNAAERNVMNAKFAGNPQGKATGKIEEDSGKKTIIMNLINKMGSADLPKDPSDFEEGVPYKLPPSAKLPKGGYGIWNAATQTFEAIEDPATIGPTQNDQIIRRPKAK